MTQVRLPARRSRIVIVLAISVAATAVLAWAVTQPDSGLDSGDWYVGIFPVLAVASAYRILRPRVPLIADPDGLHVNTGLPVIGLKTNMRWEDVARVRVTATDLLLVELRDADAWAADKPWLVRANVRAHQRKFSAAAALALRELQPPPGGIVPALRGVAGAPVEALSHS